MKHLILFLLFCGSMISPQVHAAKNDTYSIKGTISLEKNGQYVYLLQYSGDTLVVSIDSTLVKKGAFRFRGPASVKDFAVLVCGDYPEKVLSCEVLLESGKIQVAMNDTGSLVSGTKLNDLYTSIVRKEAEKRRLFDSLPGLVVSYSALRNARSHQIADSISRLKYQEYVEITEQNLSNAIGLRSYQTALSIYAWYCWKNVDYRTLYNIGDEEMKRDPEVLSSMKSIKESEEHDRIVEELKLKYPEKDDFTRAYDSTFNIRRIIRTIKEPQPYKDFKFCSVNGDSVSLSQFVGKSDYLLVEIWASWCGPCKQLIPRLKEVWNEHGRSTLNMISISIDSDDLDWRREMKNQNMPWEQFVIAGASGQSNLHQLYKFSGIPYTIVIDKNGMIDEWWFDQNVLNLKPVKK